MIYGARGIGVSLDDANNFSCNAVNIGDFVVMNNGSDDLIRKLNLFGLEPIFVDLSEFMLSGGSAKCLTLEI